LKKLAFILFLFCSVLQAQTVLYVSPLGSDITGDGSSGNPWQTIGYAVGEATSGDVVHVGTGTYNVSSQIAVGVGISIEGESEDDVTINSTVTNIHGTFYLYSVEGTYGSQHISGLTMDGGLTAHSAIWVMGRSDVRIYSCTFTNFFSRGVTFTGAVTDVEPTTYAVYNMFYDNYLYNNADYYGTGKVSGDGKGNLVIGGQDGFVVFDNYIEQPLRSGSHNTGYPIKFEFGGYYRNLKIYNNTIIRCAYDGTWDFAMELWHCRGGIEIYNNRIQGGIDFGGSEVGGTNWSANDPTAIGYAAKVYNNDIGFDALQSVQQIGIYLERGHTGGMYIYNNIFRNHWNVLQMYGGDGDTFEDVYFYSNIINGVGQVGTSGANTTEWGTIDVANIVYDNINFVNNTIYAGTTATLANSGLRFTLKGTATNITIRNNIIRGFRVYPIYIENSTINTLSIENNLYYDNGTNDEGISGGTLSNVTNQNNIVGDPLFLGATDFHIESTSPARAAGIYNALPVYDYDGIPFNATRSIGAYEFYSGTISVPTLTTTTITDITNTTASSGGNITSTGGAAVTARGVCWSTSENPTTADSKTTNGTGTGTFTSSIIGLTTSLTYFVRAYATNSVGTAYGNQRSFIAEEGKGETIGSVLIKHNGEFVKVGTLLIKHE